MSHDKPPAGAGPESNPLLARVEAQNEEVVRSFNRAWSDMDPAGIVSHLADDCVYMVYEGGPVKRGVTEIRETLEAFMKRWQSIEFRVYRLCALGSLVIHERQEIYRGRDDHPDWEFNVTGLLILRDGKIREWRDYALPGARQIFS
jgi:uncharacterized protein (TIGR02246 family)